MKLYYDMLIPYMPDSTRNEQGELINDAKKTAGRLAMTELSNFQNTGNVMSLYQSVIFACNYVDVDLVDTILNIPDDIDFPEGTILGNLTDEAAKMLFTSIKDATAFDIYKFTANILTVAHAVVSSQTAKSPES